MAAGFAATQWGGDWARRPRVPPLREWWVEWRHYWVGRRDGSRCLPGLSTGAPPPAHLQRVSAASTSVLERRWTELLAQTEAGRIALSRLIPEVARAEQRRDLARAALDRHLATAPGEDRRFGEDRVPQDLVRRRRMREHGTAAQALTVERDRTRNYVTQLVQQRSELESRMSLELEVAQSQAREQHRLFTRSVTSYLRGAQRTHHDPEGLIKQYRAFILPLPAWVSLDGLAAFLRASGAESDAS